MIQVPSEPGTASVPAGNSRFQFNFSSLVMFCPDMNELQMLCHSGNQMIYRSFALNWK